MTLPDPEFVFAGWQLESRTLSLHYALSGGDSAATFEEVIHFPPTLPAPDPADPAVRAAIDLVHLTFGVSYYKVSCPAKVKAKPVPEAVGAFLDTLYTEGLGEFYFRNSLNPPQLRFPRRPDAGARAPYMRPARERALVLVGGGKDSVVAREVLRHAGVECDAISLGTAHWIETSAAAMGIAHHVIGRTIDPKLFEINQRGARNGHVPVSACIAAVCLVVAISGGYTAIVAANERSADEGNTFWNGFEVNHQWSKSFRFETLFRGVADYLVPGAPLYFSILRPLSELAISAEFARHRQYHTVVSSCNKNFRVHEPRGEQRWCGRCPKCVFVYLMVGAHAETDVLASVFGGDFLADASNLSTIADLAGVGGMKPFECVGTPTECRAALGRLHASARLSPDCARWYEGSFEVDRARELSDWSTAMSPSTGYALPENWRDRLDAYLRAP